MAIRTLTNAEWGFDSNCFVCEPKNAQGLRVPFTYDDEAGVVAAQFSLGEAFSGAPSYIHGGIVLAILDEAMAWAAIAIGGAFAMTATTQTTFHRPVRVGSRYRVEARIEGTEGTAIETSASVFNAGGNSCADSTATFVVLSTGQAESAIGTTMSHGDARFARPTPTDGAEPPGG